ncbi:MAG: hypothetical protein ACTSX6_13020 [Candidatus Heimdallarchaeaceae archaeon]
MEISVHTFELGKERVLIALIRDIKDRKRRIQEEKYANIGKLAGGIAHYFNNMLAVIIGAIDLLN